GLVGLLELDARVVVPEDRFERGAGLSHAEGPDLAEADAVAPPLAREDEALDRPRGVAFAVDDEEVLAQPEAPADLQSLQDQLAPRARDRHLDDAAGDTQA